MKHILICEKCKSYTMKQECCGQKTVSSKPAKFTLDDKYASYRRKVKEQELIKKELL